jgi:Holliday junction resolvase
MPKFAARVDGNQKEIVQALRDIGASVVTCHAVGQGFPDICVGWQGATYLLEIKDPSKPIRDQALTPSQVKFHESWRGHVAVVKTVREALEAIGVKWRGTIE